MNFSIQRTDSYKESEQAHTLASRDYKSATDFILDTSKINQNMKSNWDGSQTSPTLTARNSGGGQRMPDKENFNCVIEGEEMKTMVRRLTPIECERLQGYEDNWTLIGKEEDGEYYYTDTQGKRRKVTDTARYRAIGNSIALPFWCWLARRIAAQYERDITIGSLFDGIGGFPYAFEKTGAKAVWASEVEEFCIAVTKEHFPERREDE